MMFHHLAVPGIVSGTTSERACSHAHGIPIDTPRYRNLLHRSRISINIPGAGYDCARNWEILAARAMLMSLEPDIVIYTISRKTCAC